MIRSRDTMRNIRNILGVSSTQGGYTLMEAVLVLVITIVMAVVVVDIIYLQAVNFNQIFNRSILLSEWRKTLGQMRVDVQEVDPDNVATMNANRLTFTDFDGQTIDYEYIPNVLTRNGIKVADWVQSDPFLYLDKDQNLTTDSDSLTFIRITLDFERNGKNIQLSELLYLRN